ncbi:interleukin-6 receptor subunit beta [Limanda limanda]|uniref:interleukin-6 receptor subunit beta n=1 Tax=Limanda limanda TaxID=27771 RepID=UPI0029C6440C|nr:interleukin-6 receptor subunit beta [Limanda limanda]XP_060939008.1 interleukin-6 receptor subunit beta [Limanda limanda]
MVMETVRVLQLLLLTCCTSAPPAAAESGNYLVTAPHPSVLEIGTNFTATCMIINTAEVTADDLYWNLSQATVPKEQYTKINTTALNVTIRVSGEKDEWLFCFCKKVSPNVFLNPGKFMHGVSLQKGYRPRKPENLSCIALQEETFISPKITCSWVAAGRQTKVVVTNFTLILKVINDVVTVNVTTEGTSASVVLPIFPNFMELEIWVEAKNKLGSIRSERLRRESGYFVKTNPPANIQIISEKSFPTSLLINWKPPIMNQYVGLTYEIRFCQNGSHDWAYVPHVDTARDIQSFRLQNIRPDTVYVTQVRCKNYREGFGYWSDWSRNATERTPEDLPKGKPDLWKIDSESDVGGRGVQFICKDPVLSNGRILRFDMKVQGQKDKVKNGSWESFPVNRSDLSSSTFLKDVLLDDKRSLKVFVTAVNSVGRSAQASLFIPEKAHELAPVRELRGGVHGGQMWLQWKPPNTKAVTEYVVQWVGGDGMDWQRENRSTTHTVIKGDLEKFVCYTVSVYPIYSGWAGQAASVEAFLEQSAPDEGPTVRLSNRKPGRNEAELVWTEIPQSKRRGFITNYTIFYESRGGLHSVTVPSNTTSFTLKSLTGNTNYDTWISASTIAGSTQGPHHSFNTLKYAPGEIELIVVGASLGFLIVVVMTMVICISKKETIKKNFWPQIPNPGESTIGYWSPDYPLKAETPKENCLSGISVLDVDMSDGKMFDEDKSSLPLKKDKYLSEEHSSGIGGSSCMSSPRQSVSDSDEGGDLADTTASTVQYSSVVASNGYKGQTPSSQPQAAIFSRSESTQPLLDCEENPDTLVQEGGGRHQRFLRRPAESDPAHFNQLLEMEQQEVLEPLDFCPLEEDSELTRADEQSADWLPTAPASSYVPQLGGYRQQ